MQTLREIQAILKDGGFHPQKRFGQNFLVDKNLMTKLLELARLSGSETVLEVGPGTGSLTEELLSRTRRVVAVEIDRGLCKQLQQRLGDHKHLVLIRGDVLASKHAISSEVLHAVGSQAVVVANLPYNIASPFVAECLVSSWRAACGGTPACRFDSLTFTAQREVAQRMKAAAGSGAYGPISVLIGLLGRTSLGPIVPASAFWPRPKVASRIVRIDFDAPQAQRVVNIDVLTAVLNVTFTQRRKQIGSIVRSKRAKLLLAGGESLACALTAAGIKATARPEEIPPEKFAALADAVAQQG